MLVSQSKINILVDLAGNQFLCTYVCGIHGHPHVQKIQMTLYEPLERAYRILEKRGCAAWCGLSFASFARQPIGKVNKNQQNPIKISQKKRIDGGWQLIEVPNDSIFVKHHAVCHAHFCYAFFLPQLIKGRIVRSPPLFFFPICLFIDSVLPCSPGYRCPDGSIIDG